MGFIQLPLKKGEACLDNRVVSHTNSKITLIFIVYKNQLFLHHDDKNLQCKKSILKNFIILKPKPF